jgi:nucleotide-binding universal stress UspA family protein
MYNIRKILVPTDFSTQAGVAFGLACSLAQSHQAELVVLHVVPPPLVWGEVLARRGPDGYEEELWQEYLLPLQPTEPGVRLTHRLEEGPPAQVIVRVAQELACDLIVMGTHGRSGLRRLLMGSVAEHVLRCAPCPVMTVRSPERSPGHHWQEANPARATEESQSPPSASPVAEAANGPCLWPE